MAQTNRTARVNEAISVAGTGDVFHLRNAAEALLLVDCRRNVVDQIFFNVDGNLGPVYLRLSCATAI